MDLSVSGQNIVDLRIKRRKKVSRNIKRGWNFERTNSFKILNMMGNTKVAGERIKTFKTLHRHVITKKNGRDNLGLSLLEVM